MGGFREAPANGGASSGHVMGAAGKGGGRGHVSGRDQSRGGWGETIQRRGSGHAPFGPTTPRLPYMGNGCGQGGAEPSEGNKELNDGAGLDWEGAWSWKGWAGVSWAWPGVSWVWSGRCGRGQVCPGHGQVSPGVPRCDVGMARAPNDSSREFLGWIPWQWGRVPLFVGVSRWAWMVPRCAQV